MSPSALDDDACALRPAGMRRAAILACGGAFFALAGPAPAHAQSIVSEVQLGLLYHDVPILSSQKEHGVDFNGQLDFVSPVPQSAVAGISPALRWLLTPRPAIGLSVNSAGYTSQAYLAAVWTADLADDVFRPGDGLFFSFGFGPGFNNGHVSSTRDDEKSLGSNILFHETLDLGYRITPRWNVSMFFDHSSDAGITTRNEGLDDLGLRVGLMF